MADEIDTVRIGASIDETLGHTGNGVMGANGSRPCRFESCLWHQSMSLLNSVFRRRLACMLFESMREVTPACKPDLVSNLIDRRLAFIEHFARTHLSNGIN